MSEHEHQLERRVRRLGQAIDRRVAMYREMLGDRPLFTEQKTRAEALAWWRQHRYDELGTQVLARMQPAAILGLDLALARQNEAEPAEGGV